MKLQFPRSYLYGDSRPQTVSWTWIPASENPGTIMYNNNCKLGSSSTCKTYKGKIDELDIVVKRYKLSSNSNAIDTRFLKELEKLSKHPNICKILHTVVCPTDFMIATEFYGDSLQYCMDKKELPLDKLQILRQVTKGLGYLHENNLVHMNLKPSNVLISKKHSSPGMVKLTCYGIPYALYDRNTALSRAMSAQKFCWTPPEILEDLLSENNSRISVTNKTDIFPLGCLFYFVLTGGLHPFGDTVRCGRNVLECKYSLKAVGNDVANLIRPMIHKKPKKRPCIRDIVAKTDVLQPNMDVWQLRPRGIWMAASVHSCNFNKD